MTSKQRAYLRSLAVELDTILYVGKGGLSPQVFREADEALEKRELIKGRVLPDTCPETPGTRRRKSPRPQAARWCR